MGDGAYQFFAQVFEFRHVPVLLQEEVVVVVQVVDVPLDFVRHMVDIARQLSQLIPRHFFRDTGRESFWAIFSVTRWISEIGRTSHLERR